MTRSVCPAVQCVDGEPARCASPAEIASCTRPDGDADERPSDDGPHVGQRIRSTPWPRDPWPLEQDQQSVAAELDDVAELNVHRYDHPREAVVQDVRQLLRHLHDRARPVVPTDRGEAGDPRDKQRALDLDPTRANRSVVPTPRRGGGRTTPGWRRDPQQPLNDHGHPAAPSFQRELERSSSRHRDSESDRV